MTGPCGACAAFWKGWDMTLVMLACVPLLAGIGVAFTVMFTKTQARGEQAYSAAAGLVQEALSSVRTVYAFCAEGRMQKRYAQVPGPLMGRFLLAPDALPCWGRQPDSRPALSSLLITYWFSPSAGTDVS